MQETQDHPRAFAVSITRDGKWQGYLTTDGGITRLKVHALTFTHEKAVEAVIQIVADNPDYHAVARRIYEVA
jgi:hypothetical protein